MNTKMQKTAPTVRSDLFLRLLDYQEEEEKKVITVAIVSEREDSYRTIITPDGCLSPMESVPVDYNHNFISTGAWLNDVGVQDISVTLNGQMKKIKARVVEVHVPVTSRMMKQNPDQTQPSIDEGSLYEAVKSGRVRWVSIYFDPVDIERDYDEKGNVKRETYKTWRLNYLSLLDKKPGQDDAFFLDMRSKNLDNNINNSTTEQMKTKKNYKRAYLGDIVKRLSDGQLGMITQVSMTEDKKMYSVKMFTDGAMITTDSVSYREESEEGESAPTFVYANMGEVIADVYAKMGQQKRESDAVVETEEKVEEKTEENIKTPVVEPETTEQGEEKVETQEDVKVEEPVKSEEVEKAKERSRQLLARVKKLKSLYREQLTLNKKLRNSPSAETKRTLSSAVDLEKSDSEKNVRSIGEAVEEAKVTQMYK